MGDNAKGFSEGFQSSLGLNWFKKKPESDEEKLKREEERKAKEAALRNLTRNKGM